MGHNSTKNHVDGVKIYFYFIQKNNFSFVPIEISMTYPTFFYQIGNFHAHPYLSLDSRCTVLTDFTDVTCLPCLRRQVTHVSPVSPVSRSASSSVWTLFKSRLFWDPEDFFFVNNSGYFWSLSLGLVFL